MQFNKTQIIFALFGILAVLYAVNIFLTNNVSNALIDTPVKISFIILEPPKDTCKDCFDANRIIKMVDTAHNVKYNTSKVAYDNAFSKKYIEQYAVKNLPAVIVSGDINNAKVLSAWSALAGEKRDGRIIIENLLPNYDVASGNIKGNISAILLKDDACKKCFNVNDYVGILGRFGMFIGSQKTYDISSIEGKKLIRKYDIKKVPMIILSKDAGDYPKFSTSWKDVGTIAKNGKFIFREVQKLNPSYKKI